MNSVIEQMKKEDKAELEKSYIRYAELLEHGDPLPSEVTELRDLMKYLGKTTEQMQLDYRLMQEVLQAETRIRNGGGLERKRIDAAKAVRSHVEETDRIMKDRKVEHHQLTLQADGIESTWMAAGDSVHHLRKLKQLHPDLLKHRPELPLV